MSDDTAAMIAVAIIATTIGIAIGLFSGGHITNDTWRSEAIQHNCAHYDGQTGDFEWNEEIK